MSLPATQQRELDGIAEALRASEPRLASMFAAFTRLNRTEAWPRREQLPAIPAWLAWLAVIIHRLPGLRPRGTGRGWCRMLVLAHVAVAVVVLLALTGSRVRAAPGCSAAQSHGALFATTRASCEVPAPH
jgi:hypothetical protein